VPLPLVGFRNPVVHELISNGASNSAAIVGSLHLLPKPTAAPRRIEPVRIGGWGPLTSHSSPFPSDVSTTPCVFPPRLVLYSSLTSFHNFLLSLKSWERRRQS